MKMLKGYILMMTMNDDNEVVNNIPITLLFPMYFIKLVVFQRIRHVETSMEDDCIHWRTYGLKMIFSNVVRKFKRLEHVHWTGVVTEKNYRTKEIFNQYVIDTWRDLIVYSMFGFILFITRGLTKVHFRCLVNEDEVKKFAKILAGLFRWTGQYDIFMKAMNDE